MTTNTEPLILLRDNKLLFEIDTKLKLLITPTIFVEGIYKGVVPCRVDCRRKLYCSNVLITIENNEGTTHVCGRIKSMYGNLCLVVDYTKTVPCDWLEAYIEHYYNKYDAFEVFPKIYTHTNKYDTNFYKQIISGDDILIDLETFPGYIKKLAVKIVGTSPCSMAKCDILKCKKVLLVRPAIGPGCLTLLCPFNIALKQVFGIIDQSEMKTILSNLKNNTQFNLINEFIV